MFLASFAAALFTLILSLLSPILALDSLLFLVLCPLCCVSSGALERAEKLDLGEGVFQSLTEGACLAVLILALALIREPLGYGTLSIPGGPQGIFCPVRFPRESYLPARIIAASAGAFFLLGYGIALFRRFGGNLAAPSPAAREGRTKG
jgi:Na+-transporting NADH:ubiquinone oxidoreductase subunit NqrD